MDLQTLLPGIGEFVLGIPWLRIGLYALIAFAAWLAQALVRRVLRGHKKESKYRPLGDPLPIGKRYNPREGQCVMFVGRLGSGKTSLMVSRGVKHARRYKLPIVTNAPIRDDGLVIRSWKDLRAMETCVELGIECVNGCHLVEGSEGCCPAVVMLDELHLWYPSATTLMPKEQQQEAFELLSYARKRGWYVLATTQSLTRVHTGYRQLVTEIYRVLPISPGYLHKGSMLDPDTGAVLLSMAAFFSPRKARYNTRAEVTPLWVLDAQRSKRPGPEPERAEPPGPADPWASLRDPQVVPASVGSVASSSTNETDSRALLLAALDAGDRRVIADRIRDRR